MADDNRGLASASDDTKKRVAEAGGNARKDQGTDYSKLGRKGGEAAQRSDNAHDLTDDERREEGEHSHQSDQ